MRRVTLTDAIYSPFNSDLVGKDASESAREIGVVLRKHASLIGQGRGYSYTAARHHYICSTMMDSVFSGAVVDPSDLMWGEPDLPRSFTHAYECACWGYCLNYH